MKAGEAAALTRRQTDRKQMERWEKKEKKQTVSGCELGGGWDDSREARRGLEGGTFLFPLRFSREEEKRRGVEGLRRMMRQTRTYLRGAIGTVRLRRICAVCLRRRIDSVRRL